MGATLHDVARLAGVSIKTVSKVVNGHPEVGADTRARVLDAVQQLGYRPNLSARGLRSGRTGVIGLVVPTLREPYFGELADAVLREAAARGLGVLVEQTGDDRDAELQTLAGGRLRFTDGLLFSPALLGQEDVDALDAGVPLVLLGERIFGGPTDHVVMHNTSSARAAVEHLLTLGRRRIALIGARDDEGDGSSSASLRLLGYRRALQDAGIPIDPALIRRTGRWNRAAGADAARGLLRDGVAFDGLFAMNDSLGLGALRALGEAGVRVPADVAVIGFDDLDESRYSVPSMSSIDPGKDEIAALAVQLLVERIAETGPRAAPRTVKPDFRLVVRESTGG